MKDPSKRVNINIDMWVTGQHPALPTVEIGKPYILWYKNDKYGRLIIPQNQTSTHLHCIELENIPNKMITTQYKTFLKSEVQDILVLGKY